MIRKIDRVPLPGMEQQYKLNLSALKVLDRMIDNRRRELTRLERQWEDIWSALQECSTVHLPEPGETSEQG